MSHDDERPTPVDGWATDADSSSPSQEDLLRALEEVYFSPAIAAFLTELSRAFQKHAMYPPAHPALRPTVESVFHALGPLLEQRRELELRIGGRRIAVGETETSPRNSLLRSLAEQLHAQELSSVTFRLGVRKQDVAEFLARASLDPRRAGQPLGREVEGYASSWPGILLRPIQYGSLGLARTGGGRALEREREQADRLWFALSSLLLTGESASGSEIGSEIPVAAERTEPAEPATTSVHTPEELAATLSRRVSETDYARKAFHGLVRISRELHQLGGGAGGALRWRASRFVRLTGHEALGRVLGAATVGERHDLLRETARWMEATAVVRLVQAMARVEEHDLSSPLALLMAKMARYAGGAPDLRPEAEVRLRQQVERLLAGWERQYELPETYRETLERLAFAEPARTEVRESTHGPEPEHVLRIGLLVDKVGPAVWKATTSLMQHRRFRALVEVLDGAALPGSPAAEELWGELATPRAVRWILQPVEDEDVEERPDLAVLDRFVRRVGPPAAIPLLDRMGHSHSPQVRRALFERLADMGPAIATHLLERLEDGRWWVRRNALALLARTGGHPATWSAHELTRDEHPAVRTEAWGVLLVSRDQWDRSVCGLLAEPTRRARSLGLRAAAEAAPPESAPLLLDIVEDEDAEVSHRVAALAILARLRPPGLESTLLELVARPKGGLYRLLGPYRPLALEPKTPVRVEALATLARGWESVPRARRILRLARASKDPDVRAAGQGRRRPSSRLFGGAERSAAARPIGDGPAGDEPAAGRPEDRRLPAEEAPDAPPAHGTRQLDLDSGYVPGPDDSAGEAIA